MNLELRTRLPGIEYEFYDKSKFESVAIDDVQAALAAGKAAFYINSLSTEGYMEFWVYVGEQPVKPETRGRKPKDAEVRDKTINLRVAAADLEILDSLCAAAGLGRWDLIKQALQEKYYDYNW